MDLDGVERFSQHLLDSIVGIGFASRATAIGRRYTDSNDLHPKNHVVPAQTSDMLEFSTCSATLCN